MLTVITSSRFADHLTPPGHPERPERADALALAVDRFRASGGTVVEPTAATDEALLRVHTRDYVAMLQSTRGRAVMLDPDTFTSPETEEVARLAAGAVVNAVDHTLEGPPASRALAVVRPPGHHAEGDRAMGFCFFNNIAIGAAHARANGVDRVAIVDYDVHHGNGTQWTFYDDPSVLFVSSHQYPFYPGTGAASETGRGAGLGFTLNLPLEAGATDDDVLTRYERDVMPRLNAFAPGLLMVSAGFDAHERDPLGGCRLSTGGFRRLTEMLVSAADRLCDGRLVLVTEGGYDLQALQECLDAVIDVCR
jgi:acetoin utilization deacetylase AcuC-like enzyme